ncbi:hypothetical protein BVC80_1195g35 [Macleaya cordata]|uniref:2-amino-4-hydroxy-6-hydroxymethyldihydropteridine diphosphokinase n=1 Tax=Macleaya cordata TaxID=56857 RepID=A0A200RCE8_MACCD|nr:hypothetical protein BVC80_1195g35 [Macleaya cordata]
MAQIVPCGTNGASPASSLHGSALLCRFKCQESALTKLGRSSPIRIPIFGVVVPFLSGENRHPVSIWFLFPPSSPSPSSSSLLSSTSPSFPPFLSSSSLFISLKRIWVQPQLTKSNRLPIRLWVFSTLDLLESDRRFSTRGSELLELCFLRSTTSLSFLHSSSENSVEVHSLEQEVVIALGSNVGNRLNNFNEALRLMMKSGIHIMRHGCLYETEPAYVTDQPLFLNSAIRGVTKLGPHELLGVLKKIEKEMGRTDGIRYSPRPIDLDILFYGKFKIHSEILTVPHERIWERPFVMAPLIDLLGSAIDSDTVASWHSFSRQKQGLFESWEKLGGESLIGRDGMRRVLHRKSVMGLVTKDPCHGDPQPDPG